MNAETPDKIKAGYMYGYSYKDRYEKDLLLGRLPVGHLLSSRRPTPPFISVSAMEMDESLRRMGGMADARFGRPPRSAPLSKARPVGAPKDDIAGKVCTWPPRHVCMAWHIAS